MWVKESTRVKEIRRYVWMEHYLVTTSILDLDLISSTGIESKCYTVMAHLSLETVKIRTDVSGGRTLRKMFGGVVSLQEVQKNLPKSCLDHLDPTSCFFPENLIDHIQTPLFLLNAAYDGWQLYESLTPSTADPHGYWNACKLNPTKCNSTQIEFLQKFRNQMLNDIKNFSTASQSGLYINSCFTHGQSERQDTWFASDSPLLNNTRIANAVGNWFFDRQVVKAIDCPYPCDKTCHSLFTK
ncbi:hypothetical protein RYX36_032401 [Vicia faba]